MADILLHSLNALLFAVAFHVWRAMRGRPAFAHQADTPALRNGFCAAFALSSVASAASLHCFDVGALALGAFRWMLFSGALLYGLTRTGPKPTSGLLAANAFAALVGYDLVTLVLSLVINLAENHPDDGGAFRLAVHLATTLGAFCAILSMRTLFLSLPADMQAPGYKPHSEDRTRK